jgi:hypothetical protein
MEEYVCLKVYILLNKGKRHAEKMKDYKIIILNFCFRSWAGEYTRTLHSSVEKLLTTHITPQSRKIKWIIGAHSRGKKVLKKIH